MAKRALDPALPLVLLLALVLASGCGGSGGGGGTKSDPPAQDAASVVPADALVYVTIDTDQGSGQLKSAQTVLDKFPLKAKAEAELLQSASKNGLDFQQLVSSVGPALDVAVLKTGTTTGPVGFAKPSDQQAFDAQLKDVVHTTVSGWTVFAKTQALLDAVTSRSSSLADDATYKDALGSIPGDAIARAYAPGASLAQAVTAAGSTTAGLGALGGETSSISWLTGALTSSSGSSFKLELHVKRSSSTSTSSTSGVTLTDQIPSGVLAALSTSSGATSTLPAGTKTQLGALSQSLGIDLASLIGIFDGPVIAYVKPGTPIPEVTLAARPPDPASAERAVTELTAKLLKSQGGAAPTKTTVDGVDLNTVALGPVSLYWGSFGGEIV